MLLDAPISLDGLFGPQFHAMVESMKTAAEQGSMSAGSSLLSAPSGSARSTRHGARARCRSLLVLTYWLITCRARGIPLSEIRLLHTVIINP